MNSEAFLALGAAAATLDSTTGTPDGSVWGDGTGDGTWSLPVDNDRQTDGNDSQ